MRGTGQSGNGQSGNGQSGNGQSTNGQSWEGNVGEESASGVGEPRRSGRVSLCAVRDTDLSLDEVLAAVSDRTAGGVVLFLGVVRDRDSGKDVDQLEYEAHPRAEETLREVLEGVASDFDVVAVAATHRVGLLQIGDLATVVGASAVHRAQAFEAARAVIDRLKARVPIWKHQAFADGTQEWVGALE
ncbi:MAG: molybdenum cofactor biosynthesis protein MoaE [Actinomycetes bacterium]